jgi:hypothetical protein
MIAMVGPAPDPSMVARKGRRQAADAALDPSAVLLEELGQPAVRLSLP